MSRSSYEILEGSELAVSFASGGVLKVPLAGERSAYAVMLASFPYFAFYSMDTEMNGGDGPDKAPLFIVAVQKNAYSSGHWGKILFRLNESHLPPVPPFFRQNAMRLTDCDIVEPTGVVRKATPDECIGLERNAVWAANHVESRLDDHYANRPNAFLESIRLKTVKP